MLLEIALATQNLAIEHVNGNVTEIFSHYRVSARAIWNAAHWPGDALNRIPQEGVEMHFIDFFDWDSLALIDFKYYLAGKEALIESQNVTVMFVDDDEGSK